MSEAGEKLLVYFDDEEHLVRRFGAAVISCWGELPEGLRARLIERAMQVLDTDETERLDEQIKRFIADHDRSR